MPHTKKLGEMAVRSKKRQAKRKKVRKEALIKGSDLPTDKEIAEGIKKVAEWWLTTPGVPIGMSPQSPLWDPLFGSQTTSVVEGVPLTQTPWVPPATVVPKLLSDAIAAVRDFEFPGQSRRPMKPIGLTEEQVYGRIPKVRSPKQLINDEIQSVALTGVNKKARKKDGSFKKGWNQKKVMRLAQRECTKERERLGLCKPKRKRKKTSSRNPYDSRLALTRRRR